MALYQRLPEQQRDSLKRLWAASGLSRELRIVLRYELELMCLAIRNRTSVSRFRQLRRLRKRLGLRIQIGCGGFPREGWLNVDSHAKVSAKEGVEILLHDVRRPFPLSSGCAELVFLSHVLEHLIRPDHSTVLLGEIYRLLKPGGVVRIVVPDAAKFLAAYFEPQHPLRPCFPDAKTWMEVVNKMAREDSFAHKYFYDFDTLASDLRRVGFDMVCETAPGQSTYPELVLDHPEPFRRSISLYVEAVK